MRLGAQLVEQLNAAAGTGGVPVYLSAGEAFLNLAEIPNNRLRGLPVIVNEYSPTLGDANDIMLVNLGYYATGLAGAMRNVKRQ